MYSRLVRRRLENLFVETMQTDGIAKKKNLLNHADGPSGVFNGDAIVFSSH